MQESYGERNLIEVGIRGGEFFRQLNHGGAEGSGEAREGIREGDDERTCSFSLRLVLSLHLRLVLSRFEASTASAGHSVRSCSE